MQCKEEEKGETENRTSVKNTQQFRQLSQSQNDRSSSPNCNSVTVQWGCQKTKCVMSHHHTTGMPTHRWAQGPALLKLADVSGRLGTCCRYPWCGRLAGCGSRVWSWRTANTCSSSVRNCKSSHRHVGWGVHSRFSWTVFYHRSVGLCTSSCPCSRENASQAQGICPSASTLQLTYTVWKPETYLQDTRLLLFPTPLLYRTKAIRIDSPSALAVCQWK